MNWTGNADGAADAETIGMVMTKLYQSEVEISSRLIKPRHLRAEGHGPLSATYAPAVMTLMPFHLQHIFDSVKASLKRLQVEYIDVLQCKPSVICGQARLLTVIQATASIIPRLLRRR